MSYQIYADQLAAIRAKINSVPGRDAWERLNAFVAANPDDPLSASVRKHGADRVIGTLNTGEAGLKDPNRVGSHEWISTASDVLGIKDYDQQKAEAAGKTAESENDKRRAGINAQLQAFADELGRGVDMSDPVFAGLIRAGQAEAGARINQTGVRGGLADLTTAEAAQRTSLPYLAQRQGMRQQALGMIANRDMGLEQLDQGWAGLNMQAQQANNQQAMQQWAQGKNNNQAMGSMVGGGVGLLGGLVATAATGGAAAPLIPALVSGGSALGAGGFGMTSPAYSPQPYSINRRPSSFSGY